MYPEKFIDYIWSNKLFVDSIIAINGETVKIIDIGKRNNFEGPDYLNCKLLYRGKKIISDVELDVFRNNWIKHKHYSNLSYTKTQLHIILYDSKINPKLAAMYPEITVNIFYQLRDEIQIVYENWKSCISKKTYCCSIKKIKNKTEIYDLIFNYGIIQFKNKSKKISVYLKKYGLLKTMIVFTGRSLGYGNNKENFTRLCENINIDFLKIKSLNLRRKKLLELVYAYLLDLSDSVASENKNEYVSDDYEMSSVNKWKILKSRPANNFLYRIKNLSQFISKSLFLSDGEFLNLLMEKISDYKNLQKFFSESLNFSPEIIHKIGRDHLNIILSNAVLPVLYAYFSLINDNFAKNKIFGMAFNLKGNLLNSRIKTIIERINLIPNIINSRFFCQLGTLYIFDNFCSKYCCE